MGSAWLTTRPSWWCLSLAKQNLVLVKLINVAVYQSPAHGNNTPTKVPMWVFWGYMLRSTLLTLYRVGYINMAIVATRLYMDKCKYMSYITLHQKHDQPLPFFLFRAEYTLIGYLPQWHQDFLTSTFALLHTNKQCVYRSYYKTFRPLWTHDLQSFCWSCGNFQ